MYPTAASSFSPSPPSSTLSERSSTSTWSLKDAPNLLTAINENIPFDIEVIVGDLVLAFLELFRSHVLHWDFKAENCILISSGHIKICDFGLSCKDNDIIKQIGTIGYAAPEVLTFYHNHESFVAHRSADQFQLGLVLHHIFTKKTNYNHAKKFCQLHKIPQFLKNNNASEVAYFKRLYSTTEYVQYLISVANPPNPEFLPILKSLLSLIPSERMDIDTLRNIACIDPCVARSFAVEFTKPANRDSQQRIKDHESNNRNQNRITVLTARLQETINERDEALQHVGEQTERANQATVERDAALLRVTELMAANASTTTDYLKRIAELEAQHIEDQSLIKHLEEVVAAKDTSITGFQSTFIFIHWSKLHEHVIFLGFDLPAATPLAELDGFLDNPEFQPPMEVEVPAAVQPEPAAVAEEVVAPEVLAAPVPAPDLFEEPNDLEVFAAAQVPAIDNFVMPVLEIAMLSMSWRV